jgi:hypothetical protein
MPDIETVSTWQGRTMVDRDSGRIGSIDAIYLDDRTGEPEWALVNTGLFGTRSSFVPLAQAFQSDLDVVVPYDKQLVADAPRVDGDQHLSEAEEQLLWEHYGLDYDRRERGRVRLRRYVTTGHVQQAVPVRRERVAEELRRERIDVVDGQGTRGRHERRRRR